MIKFKEILFKKGIFLLFLFIACYIAIRIFSVSLTIDEASTFFSVTYLDFWDVLSFKMSSANNHWLNSILVYILTKLGGDSVVLMRLPNFIAGLIYMFYSYKILQLLSNKKWFIILGFIIFCFQSYLLDFFGFARGYGLSYGFMMASVYYLLNYLKGSSSQLKWSFLFCALSIFSSFVMLNYLMALISVVAINTIISQPKSYSHLKVPGFIIITTFILIAHPLYLLKAGNELYFGGNNGFWKDTVESLFRFIMYRGYGNNYPTEFDLIKWISIVVPLLIIVALYLNRKRSENNKLLITAILLLSVPAISTIVQHMLLHTNFLFQRTGLFLFPLLILCVVASMASIAKVTEIPAAIVMLILATGSIIHFAKTANTTTTMEWQFNTDDVKVLNSLQTLHDFHLANDTIDITVANIHEATFTYYKQTMKLDWLKITFLRDKPTHIQYMYLLNSFLPQVDTIPHHTIKTYPESDCALLLVDSVK